MRKNPRLYWLLKYKEYEKTADSLIEGKYKSTDYWNIDDMIEKKMIEI